MSNKATHTVVGVGCGALAAAFQARDQQHPHMMLEILGGCFAGYLGARLPDMWDPPNRPNHRHIAHGAVNAVAIGTLLVNNLSSAQQWLRQQADKMAIQALATPDSIWKTAYQVAEWLLRMLAGALAAILAGYASHLLLDAQTSSGLPLFARGF